MKTKLIDTKCEGYKYKNNIFCESEWFARLKSFDIINKNREIVMARTTKKDLEEIIVKQNEQIKMMASFMELIAKNQGIEIPEGFITLKVNEVKENEEKQVTVEASAATNSNNDNNSEVAPTQEKPVRKRATKRIRKPVTTSETNALDNATGVVNPESSPIELLSTELNNVREVREEVALKDTSALKETDVNSNQKQFEFASISEENKEEVKEVSSKKNFSYVLGTFVGKAVAAVTSVNWLDKLSAHREKHKAQYNDNERLGFPDEVVVDTSSNPSVVSSVERALKEQAEKINAKMNVVRNGVTSIYSFISKPFNTSEEKKDAKLADAARKVFVAAGVKVENNQNNRKTYLESVGHNDLIDYLRKDTKKDIQANLDMADIDLSSRGYTKTEMGFMHSSLAQVAREQGADVVANHIIRNVIPDLNKNITGAMELYGDVRKIIAKDADFAAISSVIKKNKLDMNVDDFLAIIKEDKNALEPLHKLGQIKIPNKLKERLNEVVDKHESYQAKISNIFGGLSVYISTVEAHRRVIAGLDIDDAFKEKAFEFINDTKYKMSKKSEPTLSQISNIIRPYIEREKELLREEQEKNQPVQVESIEDAKQKALDAIAKAKSVISDLENVEEKKPAKTRAPRKPRDPNAPPRTRKKAATMVEGSVDVAPTSPEAPVTPVVDKDVKNNGEPTADKSTNKIFMAGNVMSNIKKTEAGRAESEEVSKANKSRTP